MQGFRMKRSDGNYTVLADGRGSSEFERREVVLALPASLLDALGVDSVLGVATVFDVPVLDPLESQDETGVPVAGMQSGVNINLFSEEGMPLNVSGLEDPILLTLPHASSRASCAFWKDEDMMWSFQGLMGNPLNKTSGQGLECQTRHLTFFGAIIKGFLMAVNCAQLQLLTIAAFKELFRGDWFVSPFALLYWFLLLCLAVLLTLACVMDFSTKHLWDDSVSLVPQRPRAPDEVAAADAEEPEPFSVMSCMAAPFQFCFSSAWRDILDEIASRWFSYFGEVRECCESICGSIGLPSGTGPGFTARIAHILVKSLVSNASSRYVSASLRISMDMVNFIMDDKELGNVVLEAARQSVDGEGLANPRLEAWARLHDQAVQCIDKHWELHSTWCGMPRAIAMIFCMSNPVVGMFYTCYFQTRSQRVMVFICELLGALMMSCVFFEASGGAASKNQENKECESEGMWEEMGQLIAIAVASLLIAGIPVLLISSLHSRSFVTIDYEGCNAWKKQLRSWQVQDRLFWCAGGLYSCFCGFFVAVFLANVGSEDHGSFGVALLVQLSEEEFLIPLAMALCLPVLTTLAVSLAWYLKGGSKAHFLKECREEKDAGEGNWHKIVLAI